MKETTKRRVRGALIALVCFLLGGLVTLGVVWKVVGQDGRTLLQAYQLIRSEFVGEYDSQTHLETTLETMVDALGDRWSYYLTPEEAQQVKANRENTYVGIGITVGQNVEDGTTVSLEVEGTDGARRTVEVTRQEIHGVTATWTMTENQVGLVTILNFYAGTADLVKQGVAALQEEGAQALVFDLRNNPGGYVTELTEILDYLLPEGNIFISRTNDGEEVTYTSDASCVDLPMAVLVNANSYSAAEFFAAQLRESVGAPVIGEQTSGKGYSQILFDLPDGSAIGLSTARYYTGKGVSLIGTGLTPDTEVTLSEEDQQRLLAGELTPAEDAQFQAAVAALGLS